MPKALLRASGICLILILVFSGITGCAKNKSLYKDALKQYNRGDVDQAYDRLIRSLQLKPGYDKAQNLLLQVYPDLLQDKQEAIMRERNSADPLRWARMVNLYTQLQGVVDSARRLPRLINPHTGLAVLLDYPDFSAGLQEARVNAAEYHYQQGISMSRSGNNQDIQKQAALEFRSAMNYIPNYKDAQSRFEQARQNAIKRIAVVPFEDLTGTNRRYGDISSLLVDQIISQVLADRAATEFVEIINREMLNPILDEQRLAASGLVDANTASAIGALVGAHEILTGKITQIAYIAPRISRQTISEQRRIRTGREEYVDEDGFTRTRDIYSDVEASFTRYTKATSARITATYNIVDVATGRIIRQDTHTAESNWSDTWGRKTSGDDRAFSGANLALVRKSEPDAPADIELVNDALEELSRHFVNEFKSYLQ